MSPIEEQLELAAEFSRAGDPLTAATRARQALFDAMNDDDRTEARIAVELYDREAGSWRAKVEARERALATREVADSSGLGGAVRPLPTGGSR